MIRKTVITITLESERDEDNECHQMLIDDLRSYGYMDYRTTSGGGPVKYRFSAKEQS
jgi:hypothetical protein